MKGGKRMSLHSLEKYLLETIYYHQTLTFSQLNIFDTIDIFFQNYYTLFRKNNQLSMNIFDIIDINIQMTHLKK